MSVPNNYVSISQNTGNEYKLDLNEQRNPRDEKQTKGQENH